MTDYERLARDPVAAHATLIGESLTSQQRAIFASARKHRKTLVRSAHGTGKSHAMAALALMFAAFPQWFVGPMRPGFTLRIVCTASTNGQVHDILWREIQRQNAKSAYPIGGRVGAYEWDIAPGRSAIALSVGDPVSMQGKHAEALLVLVDEGEGLDMETMQALDSLMSGSKSRMVIAYNPVSASGPCYEMSLRPDVVNLITLSALDHPNVVSGEEIIPGAVTREWVEEVRVKYGEDSDFWRTRVLGQHSASGTQQIITREILEAAAMRDGRGSDRHMGFDVARSLDGDYSTCALVVGGVLVDVRKWQTPDLMDTVGRGIEIAREFDVPPEHVHPDTCGVGGGVVDRMRELGWDVDAVDAGAEPRGSHPDILPEGFRVKNVRAELAFIVRESLRTGALVIPHRFHEVWSDLMSLKVAKRDSEGRMIVTSKDDLRKVLKRSPDAGDAVLLACARHAEVTASWL